MSGLQLPAMDNLLDGPRAQAERARLEGLAERQDSTNGDRAALEKVAREFEGVFMNELLKSMRATVPQSELFNGSGASNHWHLLAPITQ